MKRLLPIVLMLFTATAVQAQTTRPVPQVQHALLISVDGPRPDVLLRADAPRIRSLYESGAFSFWARTTPASITLPSHVSMLTGQPPEAHGILWNAELPFAKPVYPNAPTLFELAKQAGYTTALAAGKRKFAVINKPGTIDYVFMSASPESNDEEVATNAVRIIKQNQPGVMFVHFPGADIVGHAIGWGTSEQLAVVKKIDGCIGELLDALAEAKLLDSTFIIVTADHGGAGRIHGADDVRSRYIPWIATGPGIRKGFDLTMLPDAGIETYDTTPTICFMLGIPIKHRVKGNVIKVILADQELLAPATPPTYAPSIGEK